VVGSIGSEGCKVVSGGEETIGNSLPHAALDVLGFLQTGHCERRAMATGAIFNLW